MPTTSEAIASNIPVPTGARVPVAALDDRKDYTPQQAAALEAILRDFEEDLTRMQGAADETPGGLNTTEVWKAAQMRADQRYLTLFGFAAYEALHRRAAIEALREAQAASSAPSNQ